VPTPNLLWIETFLPKFRCPDTKQSLRWATAQECLAEGLPEGQTALVREDGSRLFLIDAGIPILLPVDAEERGAE